jgi:sugar phosphate isomerase/epimerase
MERSDFIKISSFSALGLGLFPTSVVTELLKRDELFFDISLAQWSLHRTLQAGKITTLDFPKKARACFDIGAIEYVSQFFATKAKDIEYLKDLKTRCKDNDVKSLLIMVDNEGHLASTNTASRNKAVEDHKKWVDAAKFLGCHSIRVNLHGDGNEQEWKAASIDGLGKLVEYGASQKMNILVENHGQWSSKGYLIADVMKHINNKYCGTLPDFGNFCVQRRDGDLWVSPCIETYDAYKGVDEMMPYAKGVSCKTYDFDANGNDTKTDFVKMLQIIKAHKYNGYIGIEYEGDNTDEDEGIRKTIALLKKSANALSE